MQDSASSDEREIRAARNQALFRAVNERILELSAAFGDSLDIVSVACECARLDCVRIVDLRHDAYRTVRANPRHFIVLPDHVYPDVEVVVDRTDAYAVVEPIGAGVPVVELTFPGGDGTDVAA